jgi:ubiquinone/menaquinone biosynthesis C-methylase UbiE
MGDPEYLRTQQYGTGANLSARIALHQRFTTDEVPFSDWLFDRMALPSEGRIIELGCGTGSLWRAVAHRVSPSCHLLLTDFSEGMVWEAKHATESLPCRVQVAVADAAAIPLRDAAVDVVVAHFMLYHVPDLDRTLEEIRRVLAPGGTLSAATIGQMHLRQLHELVAAVAPEAPPLHFAVRRFTVENGAERLARWFPKVEMEPYEGQLRVTEADAILEYIRSTGAGRHLGADDLARIAAAVQDEIDRTGAFVLDTRSALFTSRAAPR